MGQEDESKSHPPWIRPGRPDKQDSVLPFLLERNAEESPDRIQFRFEDGEPGPAGKPWKKPGRRPP